MLLDSSLLFIFADKYREYLAYMLRWRNWRLKYEGVPDRGLKLYPAWNYGTRGLYGPVFNMHDIGP